MQASDNGAAVPLDGEGLRIAIVRARFNDAITTQLEAACVAVLAVLGVAAKHLKQVSVPGALEIPLALKALAESEEYEALIAVGCVIRGETYHFELGRDGVVEARTHDGDAQAFAVQGHGGAVVGSLHGVLSDPCGAQRRSR